MTKQHRTQAMGKGTKPGGGDPEPPRTGGHSAGGPYPNPHTGKEGDPDRPETDWHGGQSVAGYHGPEQLGKEEIQPGGNPNSGAKK